jgi:hypothetical protein
MVDCCWTTWNTTSTQHVRRRQKDCRLEDLEYVISRIGGTGQGRYKEKFVCRNKQDIMI